MAKGAIIQAKNRKRFSNYTSDRGLIFKLCKELKKNLDIKKNDNPIHKWGMDRNRILKRGSTNGSEALKEIFNNFSHQGNANRNYSEISS